MSKLANRVYPPLLAGLIVLTVLAVALRNGLLFIMVVVLGLTTHSSYLWGRYSLSRLSYRRHFARPKVFVGETVELTIETVNRKVLPVTHLSIEDTFPEELQIGSRKLRFQRIGKGVLQFLFRLSWYQKVIRHYQVTPLRRGFYTIGPAVLRSGDPFGYVEQVADVEETEHLVVYPQILPLEAFGLPSRRPFGDLKSRDRLFEDPVRFAGVREYQPGDPLKRVHWKASAVTGHLQVKLQDPSSNPGLAVFLNTWGFDLYWHGFDPDVLETSCRLVASIGSWASTQEIPLGLFANAMAQGWGFTLRLPVTRGPEVLPHVLEGLARINMPARDSLESLLLDETPSLSYGTTVVIITGQVSLDLAAAALKVHQSGRPVTLILVGRQNDADLPHIPGVRLYRVTEGEEALHATVLA